MLIEFKKYLVAVAFTPEDQDGLAEAIPLEVLHLDGRAWPAGAGALVCELLDQAVLVELCLAKLADHKAGASIARAEARS